ncbi:MAG TPA: 3-hydroxy-2-methylbutyryl-CoA dehydrogenase [Alphaproteobacteria bacterium]|nr:3-hydroxy-2-methylbutyryl-CoA dehydrogenase [Alphaproteobacteria bacterium]HAJ47732.1 3-hydroxy-2-methylbutyryl-CoA dehydrogenase [Alphaproteobacteria bacterium]
MDINSSITAIVTGGASGLGEATARALAGKGAKVVIFDMNAAKGETVAGDIKGLYCNVNVTSEESVVAGFQAARAAFGQERVLVNCAGTGNAYRTAGRKKDGTITMFPVDQFDRIIQINLVGTFRCIAHAAAGMLTLDPVSSGERGVIINTGSVAAEDGQIGQAAYSASKGGVVGMTLPIARDLAREGVRVNTILPGLFRTPLMTAGGPEFVGKLEAQVPFPARLGNPDEYAGLALEMIRNSYFNGEYVRLDGAIRMAPQ